MLQFFILAGEAHSRGEHILAGSIDDRGDSAFSTCASFV